MKLVIVLLAIVLVALVVTFTIAYSKLYVANEPERAQQEEYQDATQDINEGEPEDYQPNDVLMRDGTIEGVGDVSDSTNSIISTEQLQSVIDNLNVNIKPEDLIYKGYDSDNNHYLYTITNSDVLIAITEDAKVGGIYNALGTDFGSVYFINGIPKNYEEIYLMVPNDKLYVTEYDGGSEFTYWASTDPSNKIVVNLNEHEH